MGVYKAEGLVSVSKASRLCGTTQNRLKDLGTFLLAGVKN